MRNLPQFTMSQKKHRSKWQAAREKLDTAVANMKIVEALELCKELANTNGNQILYIKHGKSKNVAISGVTSPHECLIMPELYLHYSSVFLYGNKSFGFKTFSDNIINNEMKSKSSSKQ